MREKDRILIVRFSSIGDIVLTTPVIRAIANQWSGGAEVHFLCKKEFAPVLQGNPYLHKVWTIEHSVSEVAEELRSCGFRLVVDLHRNLRSASLIARLNVPFVRFRKHNFAKWLLVTTGINVLPEVHIVTRYLQAVARFGISDDGKGLDFIISDTVQKSVAAMVLPETYAVFAIGAAHEGKRADTEQWKKFIQDCPLAVVLVGGKQDSENGYALEAGAGSTAINLCGKLSIAESAEVIRRGRFLLCGDTGMMHIGAALRKKIIAIWGCTVPAFGMYPFRPHPDSISIEPVNRRKRPCSKLGNRCKYGMAHRCITAINPGVVAEAMLQLSRG